MSISNATQPDTSFVQVINPSLPHDDYGPQVILTVWVLSSMAFAWLALRIYCKFLRSRRLWWDDYVLIVSWVVLLGGNISITFAVGLGFGKHTYDINLFKFSPMLFVSNCGGSFLIVAAALSKTAFAITLLRISSGWQKSFVWFIIASINAVFGVSLLLTWIRCSPVEKAWLVWLQGTCWPYQITVNYNTFTAAYSGMMDITLALLPWNILWGLSINKKEKISALAAMSMGIFAGITSFVKIFAIQDSNNADIVDTVQLVVLGTAEVAVTVIAASVPILRALARDKIPQPGPFLALDETDRWTRQRLSDVITHPEDIPPVPSTPHFEDIEMQPTTKKKWAAGRAQVQHLSQIEESDEGSVDRSQRSWHGGRNTGFKWVTAPQMDQGSAANPVISQNLNLGWKEKPIPRGHRVFYSTRVA
ncbi:hypothetical protein JX265_001197 [Neoarthrinium moseri]|uniref:Rhodopsin domain-containing protein n=1 Tax=Neoarthrinium moseri TaxID=1658444 RepID=A0A9Q0ARN8_9PEZI|nr:hypothetical protein JX265_001197 [Neoarthrinium moseri]